MKTVTMTRKEWIDSAKRKLDDWDATLDALEKRASDGREAVSDELRAKLATTRSALDEAQRYWKKVRHTASDVWDAVSEEISVAWDVNRVAFERSLEEVRGAFER